MSEKPDEPNKLDYATPKPPREKPDPRWETWRSAAAATVGLLALLFGAFMLLYGIPGIAFLIRRRHTADGMDVVCVVVFNLIGLVAVFFGARWFRAAFKDSA
jgi:hypothetical protein